MRVMLQLRSSVPVMEAAFAVEPATTVTAQFEQRTPGLRLDHLFAPVQIPQVSPIHDHVDALARMQPLAYSSAPEESNYLVRGEIEDDDVASRVATTLSSHPDVTGVFADPVIQTCAGYCGQAAVGADKDVARLLDTTKMRAAGMDGSQTFLAIVDTGINLAFLQNKGLTPKLDVAKSWTPAGVATTPGQHPVAHGTMCAYDALIAAPKATLLDYAVLLTRSGSGFSGLLSDAVSAYAQLRQVLTARPAPRGVVVSNSWGLFDPRWDFPPGTPGNYSDSPAHPFNIIVGSLEAGGADVLFAAGNCGHDCPDGRCNFGQTRPICGANSHPAVLSIAGVDTQKRRVGYSSQGPGRLSNRKPDISCYTHFTGSGVFAPDPDSGTSAACPTAAGALAALRSRHPVNRIHPAQMRSILFKTAEDAGAAGFDYDYGWGILSVIDTDVAITKMQQHKVRPKKTLKRPAKKRASVSAARKATKAVSRKKAKKR